MSSVLENSGGCCLDSVVMMPSLSRFEFRWKISIPALVSTNSAALLVRTFGREKSRSGAASSMPSQDVAKLGDVGSHSGSWPYRTAALKYGGRAQAGECGMDRHSDIEE